MARRIEVAWMMPPDPAAPDEGRPNARAPDAAAQHLPPMLTPLEQATYREQGWLVLPGFKTADQVAAVCARARAIVDAFDPAAGASRFSTRDRSLVADARLLASAEAVHCFFEEEALDAEGRLVVPKAQSINKIGHALHDLDPVFSAFSKGLALAELAADLGLVQPQVWQSQVIFKQPQIGGEVGWHQDASFFETDPITVTTFWFALEDATLDNGCLWAEPGGHQGERGELRERYLHEPAGGTLRMDKLSRRPWPSTATALPLPVEAGTLIVFHGLLPHYSAPNRSPRSRMAYTLHATCGTAAYSARNWLQRSAALPVRSFV
jgi:phytanoyl-CoA hydroxylase